MQMDRERKYLCCVAKINGDRQRRRYGECNVRHRKRHNREMYLVKIKKGKRREMGKKNNQSIKSSCQRGVVSRGVGRVQSKAKLAESKQSNMKEVLSGQKTDPVN